MASPHPKMKQEEFNLSENVLVCDKRTELTGNLYAEEDIKEFIKRLKEELMGFFKTDEYDYRKCEAILDKLVGDKLI